MFLAEEAEKKYAEGLENLKKLLSNGWQQKK